MLYLVRPYEPLMWNNLPGSLATDAVAHGSDLSQLGWEATTDTSTDDVVIGLALRHGVQASTGIVLDGQLMALRVRPNDLAKSHRNVKIAQAGISDAHHDLMEALIPGWKQYGAELDARIDEDVEKTLNDAVAELRAELEVPVKPELEALWTSLGGRVPQVPHLSTE